jgi:hypothetical protein
VVVVKLITQFASGNAECDSLTARMVAPLRVVVAPNSQIKYQNRLAIFDKML